jgi:hypothetical protein
VHDSAIPVSITMPTVDWLLVEAQIRAIACMLPACLQTATSPTTIFRQASDNFRICVQVRTRNYILSWLSLTTCLMPFRTLITW